MASWRRAGGAAHIAQIAWIVALVWGTQVTDAAPVAVATYQNPIKLENEWPAYGTGDPFVLRWNGRYYLYPSTKTHHGGEVGVRVWVSEDLVTWRYAGYASRDRATFNAFAPEVVYWNGYFYMYTSSDGRGHYVLRSESPTGPFVAQTGNIGLSIDGSVFIDDDGQWYFTHAGFRGIRGYRMSDPYTVGTPHILEADLGAWTEGSSITKRGGYYFITYTGNHVRSAGYRVNYAVSSKGPLGPYVEGENNPILINTDEDFLGLGHNSVVLGPDLDSHYIVYHNILNRHGDHIRELNIDRLVFNGRKMAVLGPTRYPQAVPRMPDFYTWVDEDGIDARWIEGRVGEYQALLSVEESAVDFTAEFNMQLEEEPECDAGEGASGAGGARRGQSATGVAGAREVGAVIAYAGDGDFIAMVIDVCAKTLRVESLEGGARRTLATANLWPELDFVHLHTIRAAKASGRLDVYVDNLHTLGVDVDVAGGKIGYLYKGVSPVFRFTAFSNDAGGSSDRWAPKPVPGSIEAVHYGWAGQAGVGDEAGREDGSAARAGDVHSAAGRDTVMHIDDEAKEIDAVALQQGQALTYAINVKSDGLYAIDVLIDTVSGGELGVRAGSPAPGAPGIGEGSRASEVQLEWLIDGEPALAAPLPAAPVTGGWFKVPAAKVRLSSGFHTLTLRVRQGELRLKRIDLYRTAEEPFALVESLAHGVPGTWEQYGEVEWRSYEAGIGVAASRHSMIIAGSTEWTDYTLQVEMQIAERIGSGEAGVLVRATYASYHPDQVRDSVRAYFIALRDGQITLDKLNYNSKRLAEARLDLAPNARVTLRVEARGPVLKVYVDDSPAPLIEYADPDGWMYGAVGLRSTTTRVAFRNVSVRCDACPVYAKLDAGGTELWLSPYAGRYDVVLPFGAVTAPEVRVMDPGAGVQLVDPGARIDIDQATSIPGEARVRVIGEDGALRHEAVVALTKVVTPAVHVDLPGYPGRREGWAGQVSKDASVAIEVNGPDELLQSVLVTLARVQAGELGEAFELYRGDQVPQDLVLATQELADGTYELTATVESVYGTAASHAVRFAVRNWTEIVDDLLPPLESFLGRIERHKTAAASGGWRHVTEPAALFGDRDRLARAEDATEYLVWDVPGVAEARLAVYVRGAELAGRAEADNDVKRVGEVVEMAVSRDMHAWDAVPYDVTFIDSSDDGWVKLELVAKAPAESEARYLRVTVREGLAADALQLGQARFLVR